MKLINRASYMDTLTSLIDVPDIKVVDELIKKRLHSGFELSVDELCKRHGRCRLQLGYPSCCQEGAHDVEILL